MNRAIRLPRWVKRNRNGAIVGERYGIRRTAAFTYEIPSEKRVHVVYMGVVESRCPQRSRCTCAGFAQRGYCKHQVPMMIFENLVAHLDPEQYRLDRERRTAMRIATKGQRGGRSIREKVG